MSFAKGADACERPFYAGVPTAEGGARARQARKEPPESVFQNARNVGTVGASASESVSPADITTDSRDDSRDDSPERLEREGVSRRAPSLGYEALPKYSPDATRRLETSVVRWLARTGLLGDEAAVAKKSFVALCPALATGVALCDLVTAIEGVPVVGVFRNPKSVATAEANARRACERLARHKNMSRRFLFRAADVAAGVVGVLLGLLEDVRVFHDGHPPRVDGSKKWDPRVPYCPEEDFGLKGFGLKGARATGGGGGGGGRLRERARPGDRPPGIAGAAVAFAREVFSRDKREKRRDVF